MILKTYHIAPLFKLQLKYLISLHSYNYQCHMLEIMIADEIKQENEYEIN